MSWKRKRKKSWRPSAAWKEDWFVFSFLAFGWLWPLPAAGAPPKGRKQKKRQIKLTRPFSFLHFIQWNWWNWEKRRNQWNSWSLFFSSFSFVGYGRAARQCSAKEKRTKRKNKQMNGIEGRKGSAPAASQIKQSISLIIKEMNVWLALPAAGSGEPSSVGCAASHSSSLFLCRPAVRRQKEESSWNGRGCVQWLILISWRERWTPALSKKTNQLISLHK